MNKEQIELEIAELEPKERSAWAEISALKTEVDKKSSAWLPMYYRIRKLKGALEIVREQEKEGANVQ